MNRIFVVDGGGTRCRGSLVINNSRVANAEVGRANPMWGVQKTAENIQTCWHTACKTVGLDPDEALIDTHCCAGLAGIESETVRNELLQTIRGFASVKLVTDGYAALIGASSGRPCILVIVGTGMIAHRLFANGTSVALSGFSLTVSDYGSAGWMGLTLVRDWIRWYDGLSSPIANSSLKHSLCEEIGTQRSKIFHWISTASSSDYGQLARLITEAATQGDSYSSNLWQQSIEHIREIIARTQSLSPEPTPVYLSGGLAPSMRNDLETHALQTLDPQNDALHGCLLLAKGEAPPEQMIPVPPFGPPLNKPHSGSLP